MQKLLFFITLFSMITLSPEIMAEVPVPSIVGEWEKTHIVDEGIRNSDPRWSLEIKFQNDNTFTCTSSFIMEERLLNIETGEHLTEPHHMQHQLSGNFVVDGYELSMKFNDSNITVMKSCGLWRFGLNKSSPLIARFFINQSELVLKSQQGKHEFHLTREKMALPRPEEIAEFKKDPIPQDTQFEDFNVSQKDLEDIFSTYYQVSEYIWTHTYSHVGEHEDRTGSIILKDGTKIKWMVRAGGLARLTCADGHIIYLARELHKLE